MAPSTFESFGIGATPHLPDWLAALMVAVIHTPVLTAAVSPVVKAPVYSFQPATGL